MKNKNTDRRRRQIRRTKRRLGHKQRTNGRTRRKVLGKKEWKNDERKNLGHGDREQNNKGARITGVREEGQAINVGRRGNKGEQNRWRSVVD
jgi:hypothetical protein